ncbi:MAG: helix-turn-helix transcriptional regulator [Thermoleophilia bacterium]|nr:helix-turn-helix transcriptional regulator [Thermoleophilia bacterium]
MDSSRVAQYFGRRLWRQRRLAYLSQAELARLLDLDRSEIGKLERGMRIPRLDTILKLAAGVEVDPCELIAGLRWRPRIEVPAGGTYVGRGSGSSDGRAEARR